MKNFWGIVGVIWPLTLAGALLMQQVQLHQHRRWLTQLGEQQVFILQNLNKMADNHLTMSSNQLAGVRVQASQQKNLDRLLELATNGTVDHLAWMITNGVSIRFYSDTNEFEQLPPSSNIAPLTL